MCIRDSNQIARYLNEYGVPYNTLSGEVRAAISDLAVLKYEVLKKVCLLYTSFFASIRDIVGGRSGSYEEVLREAKDTALKEMSEQARQMLSLIHI